MLAFKGPDGTLNLIDIEHFTEAEAAALVTRAAPEVRTHLEAQLAGMRERERAMIAAATNRQRNIRRGEYYVVHYDGKPVPPATVALPAVTIYGYCFTRAELASAEHKLGIAGEEIAALLNREAEAYRFGWRYTRAWSATEPGGEDGEQHISLMEPITPAQFLKAQRCGWPS